MEFLKPRDLLTFTNLDGAREPISYRRFSTKGAVESYFLIVIILAIAGFLIALYFLVSSDYNTQTEICKLSVLSRATTPAGGKNWMPLKCYTTKYCLTKSMFGKCEEFAGEENIERITLPSNPQDAARKIEEINANAKYDCWEMTGRGKLDLTGDFWNEIGLGDPLAPMCIICSRIAIDKSSFSDSCKKENYANQEEKEKCDKELNKTLSLVDINNYMETHLVPGSSLTYVQTFSNKAYSKLTGIDKTKPNEEIKKALEDNFNKDENIKDITNTDFIRDYEDSGATLERAYVFSQVKTVAPEDAVSNLASIGAAFTLGSATTPIIGKAIFHPYVLVPGLVVAGATALYAYSNAEAGVEAAAVYCGNFESSAVGKDIKKTGCSLVQSVPYNNKYINSICTAIEGNP